MNKSVCCYSISRRLPDMSKCLSGTQTTGRSKSKWEGKRDKNKRQNWIRESNKTIKYNDPININIIYLYYYHHIVSLCHVIIGISERQWTVEFESKAISLQMRQHLFLPAWIISLGWAWLNKLFSSPNTPRFPLFLSPSSKPIQNITILNK